MKRAISAKGAKGTPPLPRQRRALRVVQLCLIALAVTAAFFASRALGSDPMGGAAEVVVLAALSLLGLGLAVWMGVRTVRGPQPPTLE